MRKPAGKCIFCGQGNLSKEHLWPQWSFEYLPKFRSHTTIEQRFTYSVKNDPDPDSIKRERQGQTWSKTLRVVCVSCNTGWMSQIEEQAKEILVPLITAHSHEVSKASLILLSQWIALKIMISEQNYPSEVVTPQEERSAFKETLAIPPNFKIWIARCGEGGWGAAFWRHTAKISLPFAEVFSNGRSKNTHSVSFGIGNLFVLVHHSTVSGVLERIPVLHQGLTQVYPLKKELSWPSMPITWQTANSIASILYKTTNGPNVLRLKE